MSQEQNFTKDPFEYYSELKRIRVYFCHKYSQPLSEQDAADIVGMEVKHFSKFFISKVGIGFKTWIRGFQIEKAVEAIRKGNKSLTEIAFEVGFGDYGTFNRNFKRHRGQTPRQFKNAIVRQITER